MQSPIPILMTPIGLCKHRDRFCPHDQRTYRHVREMGYNAIILGFLDQWDEDLSFLEFYGRSEAVPGLIPDDYRRKNRAELSRRLKIATEAGLSIYMSIASPLGPKSKMFLDNRDPMQSGGSYPGGFTNNPRGQFGKCLGPDEELCVGHPNVRRFYNELIIDIVRSFPEIRGFSIFGGDFYSSMCRKGACPRCGDTPEWQRFADWVAELAKGARSVRPDVEMYIVNWPWWDEIFKILQRTDRSIGFVISSAWGFRFGEHGQRYPSLTPKWWMYDFNANTAPVELGERPGTIAELHDPWSTLGPAGRKCSGFIDEAARRGNPVIILDELSTSEPVMPFFTPNPLTTLEKLRQWKQRTVHGVIDWWGLHRQEAEGWHVDVNRQAVRQFLRSPEATDDAILSSVAKEIYGADASAPAMAAWGEMKKALDGWSIICWHQRMNWPVMMWQSQFYHRDLTTPPPQAETPPLGTEKRQDVCPMEVWQALAANLQGVIAGYDKALAQYEKVIDRAALDKAAEARLHRNSIELGRCFHTMGRHTALAYIAARENRKVDVAILCEAIGNLERIVELSDRVGTFEYRRDWYTEAIGRMRRDVRQRAGTVS